MFPKLALLYIRTYVNTTFILTQLVDFEAQNEKYQNENSMPEIFLDFICTYFLCYWWCSKYLHITLQSSLWASNFIIYEDFSKIFRSSIIPSILVSFALYFPNVWHHPMTCSCSSQDLWNIKRSDERLDLVLQSE